MRIDDGEFRCAETVTRFAKAHAATYLGELIGLFAEVLPEERETLRGNILEQLDWLKLKVKSICSNE